MSTQTKRVSTVQLAEATGYSDQQVRNWIKAGVIRATRVGKRGYFAVTLAEIRRCFGDEVARKLDART